MDILTHNSMLLEAELATLERWLLSLFNIFWSIYHTLKDLLSPFNLSCLVYKIFLNISLFRPRFLHNRYKRENEIFNKQIGIALVPISN